MNQFEREFGGVRTASTYYIDREEKWGADLSESDYWKEYQKALYMMEQINIRNEADE